MKAKSSIAVLLILVAVASLGLPARPARIRSIGVRLLLPLAGGPVWLGAEILLDSSYGSFSVSLSLSPRWGTLLLASADVGLGGRPSEGPAFLRLTAGLADLDRTQRPVSFLVGGGMAVRFAGTDPLVVVIASELVHPLAFPVPLLSISGGGMVP